MRRAHRLSVNHTTDLPQYFCVVDTETKPQDAPGLPTIHRLWFGFAIWFTLPAGRNKRPQREVFRFETPRQFWTWLTDHLTSKIRVIVSAHNLPFDFLVLDAVNQLPTYGFQVEFPILGGTKFITKAKGEKSSLWFIDSMNYLPTSLKAIGQSLGIEKLEMPEGEAGPTAWDTYCLRDVEILETFWRTLITFYRDHDLGAFATTAASMAFNAFRHKHMHHEIFIHDQTDSLETERQSYYGGRVECFRLGTMPQDDYTMLDVNSMYPYVMQVGEFPTKLLFHEKIPPLSRFQDVMRSYQVVATVGLETTSPCYPKRLDGKLLFPVGRFQTTLADPELRLALDRGDIRYIKGLIAYDHAPIFRTYVEEFYALRLAYKQEQKDAFVLFTKLLLNSLYGKLGQRGHERETLPDKPGVIFGHETIYSEIAHAFKQVYYWYGQGWIEKEEGEAYNSFPAIAATVTSMARVYLWSLLEMGGTQNVLYCDTDSIVCNRSGLQRLQTEIDPTQLGKLKVEKTTRTLCLRGCKDYVFGDHSKTKGISAKAVQLSDNWYEQIHFATFKESMRLAIRDGVAFTHVQKKLTRDYDKGTVGQDGFVSPFRLTEF